MKSLRIFVSMLFLALIYSCQNDDLISENNSIDESIETKCISVHQGIKIAILSDTHVMDPSLLVKDGTAFQAYLDKDPKLLKFSSQILETTVNKIISQRPDLVLISGDLTKDGERISHENTARILRQLTLHGIKVVVTIGNHDVNNPEAVRYFKDKQFQVPTVQANRIPFIYANFGFKDAISKDPNSLSYVNEPIKDLWIIAIDANKYYQNNTLSVGSGVIKPETMSWIKEQLAKAQSKGKL
jgi:Predicted phosphohydrolases